MASIFFGADSKSVEIIHQGNGNRKVACHSADQLDATGQVTLSVKNILRVSIADAIAHEGQSRTELYKGCNSNNGRYDYILTADSPDPITEVALNNEDNEKCESI